MFEDFDSMEQTFVDAADPVKGPEALLAIREQTRALFAQKAEADRKDSIIRDLQERNMKLYLQLGTSIGGAAKEEEEEEPKPETPDEQVERLRKQIFGKE